MRSAAAPGDLAEIGAPEWGPLQGPAEPAHYLGHPRAMSAPREAYRAARQPKPLRRGAVPTNRLVIVESPAKAKTISGYLGPGYVVEASLGHIRDLPASTKQLPEKYKKEPWAYLGVDVDHGFAPVYIVNPDRAKHVTKLKALLKDADELYLATDEDREGEAIA